MILQEAISLAQQYACASSTLSVWSPQSASLPQVVIGPNELRIREIRHRAKIFRLKDAIAVPHFCEDALYYCEYKPLSILSFGRSLDAAIRSFHEDFAMMWDVIARAHDKSLSPEARKVKSNLKALVDTVVSE